ncbi:Integral membrane protein TerC [Acididesulfobacillus acetoxydans]|uniref:Integral membrane protein TerC n=1 Tax=Acididesulfobacillus acetoxydans TaxID=1561005 RepID=A0A8S0W6I6_9FIRM|nr:TerC family protein [Acididesulfobacillus acetoxydans]CAA7599879.1 Integral membrane protein TerC [Acididesulfobacillus acetoxydans]CEJ07445.1 Integral membrane protein, YjbE [Acididesulfobacillus acetoxydans]
MKLNLLGSLLSIIVINLVLSGDNAVVIALATLRLESEQRKKAIFWGTFGAVSLRVILTVVAAVLLSVPYIQAVGGLLLTWIAVKLLAEDEEGGEKAVPESLGAAIRTIIAADLLMSLDNVLAVAGASGGNLFLLVTGLLLSIPLVIWGSTFLADLMGRWPWLVAIGAGLLGWTAGEMILKEPYLSFLRAGTLWEYLLPGVLALGVVALGTVLAKRKKAARTRPGSPTKVDPRD